MAGLVKNPRFFGTCPSSELSRGALGRWLAVIPEPSTWALLAMGPVPCSRFADADIGLIPLVSVYPPSVLVRCHSNWRSPAQSRVFNRPGRLTTFFMRDDFLRLPYGLLAGGSRSRSHALHCGEASESTQKRCLSPRIKMQFKAGTGEPMTDSAMSFSDNKSNLSLATLATNTVPSSRGA